MSRHLENLQRMLGKLQSRYGADDAIVSQFKEEVDSCESEESGFHQLAGSGARGIPGSAAQRRREVVSRSVRADGQSFTG